MAATMGALGQLGMKDTGDVSIDERYNFVSCNVKKTGTIIERQGIRGTRSHHADDTRTGPYEVAGSIVLEPTPEDLAVLLPRILGAAPSGTTFALAETLPSFEIAHDLVTKVMSYTACVVDRAVFSLTKGQPMRLTMDIVGSAESVGNAGTFPSLSFSNTTPYILSDAVLTLASSAREFESCEVVISNAVQRGRHMNALTASGYKPTDRLITVRATLPYDSTNQALYDQALAGAAGTLVLTNGGYSTTFTFAKLQVPAMTPENTGRTSEIMLTLDMVARMTSTTKELVITHDSTP